MGKWSDKAVNAIKTHVSPLLNSAKRETDLSFSNSAGTIRSLGRSAGINTSGRLGGKNLAYAGIGAGAIGGAGIGGLSQEDGWKTGAAAGMIKGGALTGGAMIGAGAIARRGGVGAVSKSIKSSWNKKFGTGTMKNSGYF